MEKILVVWKCEWIPVMGSLLEFRTRNMSHTEILRLIITAGEVLILRTPAICCVHDL